VQEANGVLQAATHQPEKAEADDVGAAATRLRDGGAIGRAPAAVAEARIVPRA
jgi:hypothetical protein